MPKLWRIFFFVALVIAPVLLRWPGLAKPIWNVDEAVTFTMAQQILAGDVPFRDAVDQRNPLAPYVQAAVFAVTGDWNLRAQHTALALMIGLTAVLLWQTGRQLGKEAIGVAGALWLTLFCLVLPTVRDTMPAHTAWYLIFFSCAGFWALARAWHSEGWKWPLVSGLAFGLSVLAKQPGVLDFGVALVLIGMGLWADPARRPRLRQLLPALLAGFAAPVLLTGAYFAAKGAWADLVYYAWTYNNVLYVPEIAPLERWKTMQVPFWLALEYHPALVVIGGLAAVGLLVCATARLLRRPRDFDLVGWLILGWSAAGLISTGLSGRGFTHYSIQFFPGLALACGWLTAPAWTAAWNWAGPRWFRRALVATLAAAAIAWILSPLPRRIRAFDLPEPGSDFLAQLVREHTTARDRIFVWGYNPEIYAISQRLPATRFLYNTFVTGLIPWTNLDALKNTDYAVVPGAREALVADWKAHPPALVADGRSQRGFMKYPLERQAWLWPLIERDYAEIVTAEAALHGFWMFQRLESAQPEPLPPGLPVAADVRLRFPVFHPGQTAHAAVQTPPGTQRLDLYLDGVLYRRLTCAPAAANDVIFAIPLADWSDRVRRVQVVAVGPQNTRMSGEQELKVTPPSTIIGGPPLDFEGQTIAALESSTITGGPILRKTEAPTHWDAHAPSRLVYPWLPGMNSLAFAYGIEDAALDKEPPSHTDGVEVIVQLEDQAGRLIQLYRTHFDRGTARRARGKTVGYTPLPKGGPGRIILQMTPGPDFAAAFDWSYWLWIRAARSPIALTVGNNALYPTRIEAPGELRQTEFNGRFITVTEAPATIEFPAARDLDVLSGSFGLLDTAWHNQDQTTPVDFAVTLRKPDGSEAKLFERTLDPASTAADRGPQAFSVRLPQPVTGTIRFSTQPRTKLANAHAFWGGLASTLQRTSLIFQDGLIPADPASEGRFGFLNTEEDGRECTVAHAPASLVYGWREGMTHLTGEFGLISGAYTKPNSTEGVVFVVETQDTAGVRREIFRRHLQPMTQKADQGAQKLAVEIPPVPGGRVILSTQAPPSGSLNAAWSYWRDLRVAP